MTYAYIDAEWLARGGPAVRAVEVDSDRNVRFGDRAVTVPAGTAPDAAALLAFGSLAAEVVVVVGSRGTGEVEVTGNGIVGALIRAALGRASSGVTRPQVVVDTTGDPAVIVDATRRLTDLGLLVLAGESLGRIGELDLYPDVHLRGLQLVGAGPLLSYPLPTESPPAVPAPAPLGPDSPQPADAPWYRRSTTA